MHAISQQIIKHLHALIFFLLISGILIFSWFRFGHLYGGGDVGLPTYNPQRAIEISKFIWWEAVAPGTPVPNSLIQIPFRFGLAVLDQLGFSPVALQASLFFLLLTLMGFGMYLFTLSVIGKDKTIYAILAGLFYMLNPYMMIQIWHRFVHTSIYLVAFLPFIVMVWRQWIKKGSLFYLIAFLLINLLAVYIYGTIAFTLTIWLLLFLISLTEAIFPLTSRLNFIKIMSRFLIGLMFWLLVNSWWIIPLFTVGPALYSTQHKTQESLITLITISKQAIIPFTLQMINPFYLFDQAELGRGYRNLPLIIIPWIFVIVYLIGLLYALRHKNFSSFGIIFLVLLFLTKGASSPFGHLYILGFTNFFPLGIIRNPFEKIGILLPFVATILFVLGLNFLFIYLSRYRLLNLARLVTLVMIIMLIIFSWPMFAGKIFGTVDKASFVDIPDSYIRADNWLNEQKGEDKLGRILHLPLTRREDIKYNWNLGYSGLEPSEILFTALPSISKGFNNQRLDDALTALSQIFHKPYYEDNTKIAQLLQAFNVRFIVLHKDLNWFGTDTYDPLETEKVLNSLNFVEKKVEFGDLVIYQVADKVFGPKIEISDKVSLVYPQRATMRVWPWLTSQVGNFVSQTQGNYLDESIKFAVKETLIFPENSFSYPEASGSSLDETIKQLGSQLNIMVSTVGYLKQLGTIHIQTEETVQNIISSSQKLAETYQTLTAQTSVPSSSIDEYSKLIDHIFPELDDDSTLYFDIGKTTISDTLKLHEIILSYIQNKLDGLEKTKILKPQYEVRQFLKKQNLLPSFASMDKIAELGQRQYINFWVNSDGEYELLLADSKIKEAYVDKLSKVNFQINDKLQTFIGKESGSLISFGNIELKEGLNEISFSNPPLVNLVSSFDNLIKIGSVKIQADTIQMTISKNIPAAIETPVFPTAGEDVFQISFEAQIPANVGLYIQVIQDIDNETNGQKVPGISFLQHLDQSNWQGSLNVKLPALALQTREAKIRLIALIPTDIPKFGAQSTVIIKNLRVIRVLNNSIFLKGGGLKESITEGSGQILQLEQKNPVYYEGVIKLSKPSFIFFKETYHPGWQIQLVRGDEVINPDKHYLAYMYGNAWFVDKVGEYKFKLEFKPQQKVTLGLYLSGIGWLIAILLKIIWKPSN